MIESSTHCSLILLETNPVLLSDSEDGEGVDRTVKLTELSATEPQWDVIYLPVIKRPLLLISTH